VDDRVERLHELGAASPVPVAGQDDDDDGPTVGQVFDAWGLHQRIEEDEAVAGVERVRAHLALPPLGPSLLRRQEGCGAVQVQSPGPELFHYCGFWQTASTLLPSASCTNAA
jgi:hypothetical protein